MQPYIWVPATLLLCYRAHSHKSLTPAGIVAAAATAFAHAVHPWPLPFVLLVVFFLAGTRVTKVKKDVKANLTLQSTGEGGGEGPRTHVQVFANSGIASVLSLLHTYKIYSSSAAAGTTCYPWGGDLLVVGIVANYAAVAADTFSSELGILSKSRPRLITSLSLRSVPPGTNGGVTVWGLAAGFLGSMVIVTASMLSIPWCKPILDRKGTAGDTAGGPGWTAQEKLLFATSLFVWGGLGSVLDSFLGGWFQASVIDKPTGKIVEGAGGKRVLIGKGGPSSMHMKKRAAVKESLIKEREGKGVFANQTEAPEVAERKMDKAMGRDGRYDADKKMRQASFGDGEPTRAVESGSIGVLDNNEVNLLMAATMTFGAMQIASTVWGVPLSSILP